MTDSTDGWQPFLDRWSQEWADAQDPNTPAGGGRAGDEEARRAGGVVWLLAGTEHARDPRPTLGLLLSGLVGGAGRGHRTVIDGVSCKIASAVARGSSRGGK
jgi:hypothetical protein